MCTRRCPCVSLIKNSKFITYPPTRWLLGTDLLRRVLIAFVLCRWAGLLSTGCTKLISEFLCLCYCFCVAAAVPRWYWNQFWGIVSSRSKSPLPTVLTAEVVTLPGLLSLNICFSFGSRSTLFVLGSLYRANSIVSDQEFLCACTFAPWQHRSHGSTALW